MKLSLELACIAGKKGEVPVGAVIVKDGKVIAKAYNRKHNTRNPLNHAEIIAINKACRKLKDFRLTDCDMYVTFEPCIMCMGAILSARISNVYFGAYDRRFSTVEYVKQMPFNHEVNIVGGVCEQACSALLTAFFKNLRS